MSRIGRAIEKGETQGFIKISVDAETKQILGAAILGTVTFNQVSWTIDQTDRHCQQMIWEAHAELGAFHAAVRQLYGEGAALRAGNFWLEELTLLNVELSPHWRSITVRASSRLAQSHGFARISRCSSTSGW
jgi:hypothetical protein